MIQKKQYNKIVKYELLLMIIKYYGTSMKFSYLIIIYTIIYKF